MILTTHNEKVYFTNEKSLFAFDKDLSSRTVLQSALIPGNYRKAAGFGSTINN